MTKKTDIVFVISDLGSGGAQKILMQLISHFSKNHTVSLITISGEADDFYAVPKSVERIALGLTRNTSSIIDAVSSNFKIIKAIRKTVKNKAPKTVMSFIGPTNSLCVLACLFFKTKLVISERNDPAKQSYGKIWDSLRRILYRFADVVTANTKNAISSMKSYVKEEKLKYIPNGLDIPNIETPSSASKEKKVLNVGRLHEQKAQDVLLTAFSVVIQKHPEAELTIIGEGKLHEELTKLASELNIQDNVTFTGKIKDVKPYYTTNSVFAFPSRYEGMPNALLEAMSYGCTPIVCNTCDGALEFVEHEKSGLIIPVDHPKALAQAICNLLEKNDLRFKLGENARLSVQSLDNDIILKNWEHILLADKS